VFVNAVVTAGVALHAVNFVAINTANEISNAKSDIMRIIP